MQLAAAPGLNVETATLQVQFTIGRYASVECWQQHIGMSCTDHLVYGAAMPGDLLDLQWLHHELHCELQMLEWMKGKGIAFSE